MAGATKKKTNKKKPSKKSGKKKSSIRKSGKRKSSIRKSGKRKSSMRKSGKKRTSIRKSGKKKSSARKSAVKKVQVDNAEVERFRNQIKELFPELEDDVARCNAYKGNSKQCRTDNCYYNYDWDECFPRMRKEQVSQLN